jgi:signal transduction histidine kinase
MGYVIDDLAADASSPRIKAGLQDLRSEITRVITELRLSIFDLRSEVASGVSLGTALADYVRSIGPSMAAEFHVRTDETTERLRFETEAELLRIAQEAITNVRRHSAATNVWITSSVAPPDFVVTIADDGQGMGQRRPDSYGMEIMRERAHRIGATLEIADRPEGGTVVTVTSQSTERPVPTGRMDQQGPPVPTGRPRGTKGGS